MSTHARILCLGAVFLPAMFAQATQIQILADRTRLTAGESIALKATLADDQGRILPTQNVSWSVDSRTANIARVDEQGRLTGVLPGVALVRAQSGNTQLDMAFQILPKRIAITPANPEFSMGETKTFTATAYDVNDRPLSGITFTWASLYTGGLGAQNDTGNLVIDQRGQARARQEGKAYIRAQINYSVPGSGLPVGMISFSSGLTLATIKPPDDYSLKVLYSTARPPEEVILGTRASPLYSTPDGGLIVKAALGAGTTGLVRYRDGELKTLVSAGGSSHQLGSRVFDIPAAAFNSVGDYLVLEQTTDGNRVRRYLADGSASTILVANAPAAGAERLNNFYIYRNSLNRYGQFVFRANYYDPIERKGYVGLFLGTGVSVDRLLLSTKDLSLPEFPKGFGIGFFGIDDNGAVYVRLTGTEFEGAQAIYRIDEMGMRKIIATGDTLAGRQVTGFLHSAEAEWQEYLVASNGDFLFGVTTSSNGIYMVRYDAATKEFEHLDRSTGWTGISILDYRPSLGALVLGVASRTDGAFSLWLWKDGKADVIVRGGAEFLPGRLLPTSLGNPCGGAFGPDGQINAYCRLNDFRMVAAQLRPERRLLFQSGATVTASGSVLSGFVRATSGPLDLFSSVGSVITWTEDRFESLLTPGTPVDRDVYYPGTPTPPAPASTYSRLLDQSVIQFGAAAAGSGVVRIARDRSAQLLIKFGLIFDGVTVYSGAAQANDAGDILMHCTTSANDNRLLFANVEPTRIILFSGRNPQYVTQVGGLSVSNFSDGAVNSAGQVLALATFRERGSANAAILWDGGNWRVVLQSGQDRLAGRAITSIDALRRAGSDFWMRVFTDVGPGVVRCSRSGQCELVALSNDIMPGGFSPGYVHDHAANTRGDFLIQASGNVFVKRDGKWRTVLNLAKSLEGHWITGAIDAQIRDDGTVYILAVNSRSETLLLEGKPKD